MVDEYKKAIQAQRKKSAWMAVGAAIVIHVLFILSEEVAMAFGLAAVGVLLYALYAETTGHRMNMVVAFERSRELNDILSIASINGVESKF